MILLLNCLAKIDIIFIFATYLSGKIAKCFIILYFILQSVSISATFTAAFIANVH